MSHTGVGLREGPAIKGGLGRLGVGSSFSPSTSPPLRSTPFTSTRLASRTTHRAETHTLSDHGNPTHPSWQSGAGQSHLQSRHPSPNRTSLPLPLPKDHGPPGVPLRPLHRDEGQPPPTTSTGSEPLPPRPEHHLGRRRLHPVNTIRCRLRHSNHQQTTRHRQHSTSGNL